MLEPAMLTAFGFKPAPRWVGASGRAGLRARAALIRFAFAPRRRSKLGMMPQNRTYPGYPDGYSPSDLGAPPPPTDLDERWLKR
jgi:hypothetical protein